MQSWALSLPLSRHRTKLAQKVAQRLVAQCKNVVAVCYKRKNSRHKMTHIGHEKSYKNSARPRCALLKLIK